MADAVRLGVEVPLRKKGAGPGASAEVLQSLYCGMAVIDVLAMPEVYENISEAEKERTEEVRVQIINRLRGVYERADQVIVLGSLLLRLHTGSMINVAVILALSRWISWL